MSTFPAAEICCLPCFHDVRSFQKKAYAVKMTTCVYSMLETTKHFGSNNNLTGASATRLPKSLLHWKYQPTLFFVKSPWSSGCNFNHHLTNPGLSHSHSIHQTRPNCTLQVAWFPPHHRYGSSHWVFSYWTYRFPTQQIHSNHSNLSKKKGLQFWAWVGENYT